MAIDDGDNVRKPTWIVQENLGNGGDFGRLVTAFKALDLPFRTVSVVPFSNDIPEVGGEGPRLVYGATRFVTNVHRAGHWRPGVFFDEETFTMGCSIARYGDRMLNATGLRTTIEGFMTQAFSAGTRVFVRPDRDLKEFEAGVADAESLAAWFARICEGDFELKADTPILVSVPVEIEAEWRLFMVQGRCVGGSRYRNGGETDIDPLLPKEVRAFGEAAASDWSPAPVFVLDVGRVDGKLKIIETNCFNSSGFYAGDVTKIVDAVTAFAGDQQVSA